MPRSLAVLLGSLAAGAAVLVTACGPGITPDPDPLPEEGPLYLVHSAVQPGDTRMNYFTLVDSLTEARTLDYSESLELAGRPRLYAAQGVGFFAIGSGEAPTITRYEIEGGQLVAGDSISLLNWGVSGLAAQAVLFVSETKAYYKDHAQGQVIVWNPTEMVVEKAIDLPAELLKDGYFESLSQWASRDGEAFFALGWTNETYDRVLEGTALIRIDTATDELTVVHDDRCRDLAKTARRGDTLYFFSGVINGLGFAAAEAENGGQQDCILRIEAGESTFDPDYLGTVANALGTDKVGTVISVTDDGKAWVQVADLAVTPHEPTTTYSEWYSKGWSWWNVPLETLTGANRIEGEAGAYSGWAAIAGSEFLISRAAADYSESTLVELSTGTPKDGISFPGFVLDVTRIR